MSLVKSNSLVYSKPYTSYNQFFVIPFIIWVLIGGILQFSFSQEELFRFANLNYNSFLDTSMSALTLLGEGVLTTVVLLVLLGLKRFRNWWYIITAIGSNVLPSVFTQLLKSYFGSPRPLKYFSEANWIHILPNWQHAFERSFPSGHTTAAFSFFTFVAFLLPRKYKPFGLVFILLALSTAYSRTYLAVHFFADVYTGSIIGFLFTVLVFWLMNRYQSVFFKKNS